MIRDLAICALSAIAAIGEWRPVDGYEGIYEVSSEGYVRSVDRIGVRGHRLKGKVLSPAHTGPMGHAKVSLRDATGTGKTFTIHVLVARAFLGERPEGLVVDHIDRNPRNNRAGNLRYTTQSKNCRNRARGKRSASGAVGVYRNGARWRAEVKDCGRVVKLGNYKTIEAAARARAEYEARTNYREMA